MNNKNKVQNPLTIIAIFAGIAELAGTTVLLGLPLEIQKVFVWFVMLFPIGLVAAFFLVLLFKHKVLYAPSDFVNENNFMNLLQNKKVQHDIVEVVELLEQTKENNKANEQLKQDLNEALLKLESVQQNNEVNSEHFNYLMKIPFYDESEQEKSKKKYLSIKKRIFDIVAISGAEGITKKEIANKLGVNLFFLTPYLDDLLKKEGVIYVSEQGRFYMK
ncbi:hypothetical protein [Paenibacillus sp. VT-400]|uniref:hypothetical protein n=1 Tax=Paenibacillus sp. VT-400 TaxID=1495853 RepID=UPI000AF8CC0F|nr:hypothetical protein [Paenibacillus sp. VT-400]